MILKININIIKEIYHLFMMTVNKKFKDLAGGGNYLPQRTEIFFCPALLVCYVHIDMDLALLMS